MATLTRLSAFELDIAINRLKNLLFHRANVQPGYNYEPFKKQSQSDDRMSAIVSESIPDRYETALLNTTK